LEDRRKSFGLTDFSSLLDVEAIGDESEVGVDESDGFGN